MSHFRVCTMCMAKFRITRSDKVYCSARCRKRSSREAALTPLLRGVRK